MQSAIIFTRNLKHSITNWSAREKKIGFLDFENSDVVVTWLLEGTLSLSKTH